MRKLLTLTLVAAMLLVATTAWAALVGSNHDMPTRMGYTGTTAKQGACSFCHIPHKALGDKLFPSALSSTGMPSGTWAQDRYAMICWDCHNNATFADAQQINPFDGSAHKREVSQLVTWGDDTEALIKANVYAVEAGTNRITCASCHNPHDNTTRPFMRDNSYKGALTEGEAVGLCDDCHSGRLTNMGTGTYVNHPVGVQQADQAAANLFSFASMALVFKNSYPNLTSEISETTANRWNLGGKMWATAGSTDYFDCGTCHTVHMNETNDYTASDGATTVSGTAIAPNGTALTATNDQPVGNSVAQMCIGCHDIRSDTTAGPGTSGTVSHAFEDSAWALSVNDTLTGAKGLAGGDLVCQSCHDVHGAAQGAGSGTNPSTYRLVRYRCADCHDGSGLEAYGGKHHPSGVAVVVGTDVENTGGGAVNINSGYDYLTANVRGDSITGTDTGVDYVFDLVGGSNLMTCGTCHGGENGKAHNNASFPSIVGSIDESEMCVDCHGVNPSDMTDSYAALADRQGSHWIGRIKTDSYYWGTSTVAPEAGAYAKSTTDAGGGIICESCHTLKIDGKSGVVSYQIALNNDNESSTVASIQLVLTSAGNSETSTTADGSGYLCTACHGSTPGGNTTHPVLPGYTTAATTAVANAANTGNNDVTLNPSNQVNCESCHRPHDADTDSGLAGTASVAYHYILEKATYDTYIDEAVLCNACHVK